MRAARIHELGSAPSIDEVEEPRAVDGREVVRARAVALNPLDLAVAAGRFYGGHPPLPYIPGAEAVVETGDGRRAWVFGDGLGVARDGTLAEQATVPSARLVPVEADVDDATAVALGIAGIAAWSAVERGRIGPGDRVLVLGASGASGLVAVQAAKLRGAEHVVAAGRDLARLERARELGADEVVALDGDFKAACGGDGPTVVIDPLWDGPVTAAAEAAAPKARIVHYGQSAGPEATFTSAAVRGKELELLGVSNFARTQDELRALYGELLQQAESGALHVDVETFALEAVEAAWRRQSAGAKSVVLLA
ncbi:MAG: quinone oxidoreductase family protein [Gaiellaceae bacterium]